MGLSASSEPPEQEAKQGAGCLGKWDRQLSCWLFQTFAAPSFDDKILEVVAVFGSMQMAVSRVIKLQHHRIAQVLAMLLQRSSPSPSGGLIPVWRDKAWPRTPRFTHSTGVFLGSKGSPTLSPSPSECSEPCRSKKDPAEPCLLQK